jgi:hypothetical protein
VAVKPWMAGRGPTIHGFDLQRKRLVADHVCHDDTVAPVLNLAADCPMIIALMIRALHADRGHHQSP